MIQRRKIRITRDLDSVAAFFEKFLLLEEIFSSGKEADTLEWCASIRMYVHRIQWKKFV